MIEVFKPEYLDEIMSIWLAGNLSAHDFISPMYWTQNFDEVRQMITQADIFVYRQENEVKAFIGISENHYISGLFVKKEDKRKGIGTELVNHVKTIYPYLTLEAYVKNNQAVCFYEKNGFKIIREEKNLCDGQQEYYMKWE